MYCPNCGKECPEGSNFCPSCGMGIGPLTTGSSPVAGGYGQTAKEPKMWGPFLLGLFLGFIGVIIAVLAYNDKDGPYTKDPRQYALRCSLYGTIIWLLGSIFIIPVILLSILS